MQCIITIISHIISILQKIIIDKPDPNVVHPIHVIWFHIHCTSLMFIPNSFKFDSSLKIQRHLIASLTLRCLYKDWTLWIVLSEHLIVSEQLWVTWWMWWIALSRQQRSIEFEVDWIFNSAKFQESSHSICWFRWDWCLILTIHVDQKLVYQLEMEFRPQNRYFFFVLLMFGADFQHAHWPVNQLNFNQHAMRNAINTNTITQSWIQNKTISTSIKTIISYQSNSEHMRLVYCTVMQYYHRRPSPISWFIIISQPITNMINYDTNIMLFHGYYQPIFKLFVSFNCFSMYFNGNQSIIQCYNWLFID